MGGLINSMAGKTNKLCLSRFAFFLLVMTHCSSQKPELSPLSLLDVTLAESARLSRPIYLFRAMSTTTGSIGGRAGADGTCSSSRGSYTFPNNVCTTVHAFISIDDAGDDIASMQATYFVPAGIPVHGPTGIFFQYDWTDLLNGVEGTTAEAAGILPVTTVWWSFSSTTAGGLPVGQSCSNGTSTVGNGRVGGSDQTAGAFYNNGGNPACASTLYLLCVCY